MITPDTVDYIARSAIWSIAGFAAGFLAGRTTRDVRRITDTTYRPPARGDTAVPTRQPRHRPSGQFIVGLVVVVLAVATVAQGIVQSTALRHVVDCDQSYSDAVAAALDTRSDANSTAQNAMDELVNAIAATLSQPRTPQRDYAMRQALSGYIAARNRAKATLTTHPLPPAPHEVCPP